MYGSLSICLSGSAPQFVAISLLVISIKRPPDKQSGSEINYVDVQACKAPRVQGLEGVRPSLRVYVPLLQSSVVSPLLDSLVNSYHHWDLPPSWSQSRAMPPGLLGP